MDSNTLAYLDAHIVLGIVNEKLRLECHDMEDLLAYYGGQDSQLTARLAEIGYHYDPLSNQFKAHR